MDFITSIPSSIIHRLHEQTQMHCLLRWEFQIAEFINFNARYLAAGVFPLWFMTQVAWLSILCSPLSIHIPKPIFSMASALFTFAAISHPLFFILCKTHGHGCNAMLHYSFEELSRIWMKNAFVYHKKLVEEGLHQHMQCLQGTKKQLKESMPLGIPQMIMDYAHPQQIEQLHIEQTIVSTLRQHKIFDDDIIDTIVRFVCEEQTVYFRICHEMKYKTSACLMGLIPVRNVSLSTARGMRLFVHFGSESYGEPEEMAAGCLMEYKWKSGMLEDQDVDEFEEDKARQSAWDMCL